MSATTAPMKVMAEVLGLLKDLLRAGGLSPRAVTPVAPAPVAPAPAPSRASVAGVVLPSRPAVAVGSSGAVVRLPAGDPVLGNGATVTAFFSGAGWSGATAALAPLPGTSQDRVGLLGAVGLAATPDVGMVAPALEGATVAAFFRPVDWSGRTVPIAAPAGLVAAGVGGAFAPVAEDDLYAYPVHQFFSRVGWKGGATAFATNGHSAPAAAPPPTADAVPSKRRETGTAAEMFGEFKF